MTQINGNGATAAALLALALGGLLAVAERAGLPPAFVKGFLGAGLLLTAALLVALSATARERPFLGLAEAGAPLAAGLALAAAVWIVSTQLDRPRDPAAWLAALLGAPLGILAAHAAARFAPAESRLDGHGPVAMLASLARLAVGGLALFAAARAAAPEAARMLGVGETWALILAAAAALAPVLFGGARGALALGAAAAGFAAVALLALVGLGWSTLGPLPLPGWSDGAMLDAIGEARAQWRLQDPAHLALWPAPAALLEGAALRAFAVAFAAAAALALALAPAAPIRRRSVAASAALALLLLPPLATAVAGYAVEAAATRFVGAPAARPPATLLGASGLGLVQVCGAAVRDADALRAACGVAPRDPGQLGWRQIAPAPAFLDGGLAAALGAPATFAIPATGLRLALAFAAMVLGLWIAARALGLALLGRRRRAPGVASLRLGLVRLAALGCIAAVVALMSWRPTLPPDAAVGLGLAALVLAGTMAWRGRARDDADQAAETVTVAPRNPKAEAAGTA